METTFAGTDAKAMGLALTGWMTVADVLLLKRAGLAVAVKTAETV